MYVERFDPPIPLADEGRAVVPQGVAVYCNPSFRNAADSALGVSEDLALTAVLQGAVGAQLDSRLAALWDQRAHEPIHNLQLTPHVRGDVRHAPFGTLSTSPIIEGDYVIGCTSRLVEIQESPATGIAQRRTLHKMEAFLRTEKTALMCLEFKAPIKHQTNGSQLERAYAAARFTHLTRSAAELFESQVEDMIGKRVAEVDSPHLSELAKTAFHAEITGEDIDLRSTAELLVEVTKPSHRIYRIKPTFVFGGDFALEAWLRIEDVTQEEIKTRARQAIEQTRALALEAASLYQFEINTKTGAVTFDDTGLLEMGLNNAPRHLAGWYHLLGPENLSVAPKALAELAETKSRQHNFVAHLKNDEGEDRYLELWAVGRSRQHPAHRIIGLYRDVTAKVRVDLQLREKKTLEGLGVLAGGVAHDFNNILMSVLGYAELMEADLSDAPASERTPLLQSVLQNLGVIRAAALRASDLCGSLLAYAGHHPVEKKVIDLSALVRSTADLLEVTVREKAPLLLDLDQDVRIEADQGQLTQVIMNLVGNAADAMEGREGVIQLTVGTTQLSQQEQQLMTGYLDEPHSRVACLTIRDSGSGMTLATMQRMYEPFFSTKADGRGLGMAAVHGIVTNHGGGILVHSVEDEGTEFRLCFPLLARVPTSEYVLQAVPLEASQQKTRVLVVDDEDGVRLIAAEMLRHLNCDVQEAGTAEEAIRLFGRQTFDCALIDVTMPVMDGGELAEYLLERAPQLNVVLCSGYTSKNVPEPLLGRCGFIQKPYTLQEVASVLQLNDSVPEPA